MQCNSRVESVDGPNDAPAGVSAAACGELRETEGKSKGAGETRRTGRTCARCSKTGKHASNALRSVTALIADRVQGNLAQLAAIQTSVDLRARLTEAGHDKAAVDRWLGSIHQRPGKYAANLKHITVGAYIHKVRGRQPYTVGA